MPDIVAAKPATGAPIDTPWGQAVHDAIEGIQYGVVNVSLSGAASGSTAVVFPRAYTATPSVVVSHSGSSALYSLVSGVTVNGFNAALAHRDGTSSTLGPYAVYWVAFGPVV